MVSVDELSSVCVGPYESNNMEAEKKEEQTFNFLIIRKGCGDQVHNQEKCPSGPLP